MLESINKLIDTNFDHLKKYALSKYNQKQSFSIEATKMEQTFYWYTIDYYYYLTAHRNVFINQKCIFVSLSI